MGQWLRPDEGSKMFETDDWPSVGGFYSLNAIAGIFAVLLVLTYWWL
jgi:hypothetical protein